MVVCSYWEGLRLGAISKGKGVIFIRGIYKGLGRGSLGGGQRIIRGSYYSWLIGSVIGQLRVT